MDAADWLSEHYSPKWALPVALRCGIGIHHGRIPRAIGQFVIRAFNEGRLRFLLCTSTLIEGVNTTAKNVVVYDKKIARRDFDFFTFNNIVGRSGRMFHHFVGRVYLFHEPPPRQLPFVDFPFVTQDKAPASLLVQLDEEDLTEDSESVLEGIRDQDVLSLEVIKENASIDPEGQILLATHLRDSAEELQPLMEWTGYPSYDELRVACKLIWDYLAGERPARGGVRTASQLTFKINRLSNRRDYATQIDQELDGAFASSVDQAVDRVLDFERSWATFHFPRFLMALHRIQLHVFEELELPAGDYSFYAARVESLFRHPALVQLDEFGLPLPLLDRIEDEFPEGATLDDAIAIVRGLSPETHGFDGFETSLLDYCKRGL